MATITLKNVPKRLHAKLVRRAQTHKRSLNREAIACLEEMVQASEPIPAHVWEERFQKVRTALRVPPLTDDFLEWAVNQGRA